MLEVMTLFMFSSSQKSPEVVGGSARQPPATLSAVGLAASVASCSLCGCCCGDRVPFSTDSLGRGPSDRKDPTPSVQQTELHRSSSSDFRNGEKYKNTDLSDCKVFISEQIISRQLILYITLIEEN